MNEQLKKKVEFVSKLNEVMSEYMTNIELVEYKLLATKDHLDWIDEYLVVHYVGGAVQARNCSGNSYKAINEELAKMLYSSQVYASDTKYYKELLSLENTVEI